MAREVCIWSPWCDCRKRGYYCTKKRRENLDESKQWSASMFLGHYLWSFKPLRYIVLFNLKRMDCLSTSERISADHLSGLQPRHTRHNTNRTPWISAKNGYLTAKNDTFVSASGRLRNIQSKTGLITSHCPLHFLYTSITRLAHVYIVRNAIHISFEMFN